MFKRGRGLLSLGTGVVIWLGWFAVVLLARTLGASESISTMLLWTLAWPMLVLNRFITIPNANNSRTALIALAIGFVAAVGILATLTCAPLSLLLKRAAATPPSPPSFE